MSETDRIARAYSEMEGVGDRWSLANRGNQCILAERRSASSYIRVCGASTSREK
ncbi:MAG TPA: hypothetical protein VGA47_04425 [Candidatus Dormibacteraeota bacterium]